MHRTRSRTAARTGLLAVSLIAAAPITTSAAAEPGLFGVTTEGDFVRIDIDTGQAQTMFNVGAAGSMAYAPFSQTFALLRSDTEPGALSLITLDGAVTDAGPLAGLPPGEQKTASVGYSGFGDSMLVTFGQTGTVFENKIALFGLDAVVDQTSPDLGLGDNDGVVWDPTIARPVVYDYNANDGLPRVAAVENIFTAPSFTQLAAPPIRGDVGDSAVHPGDGRLFVVGYRADGGMLLEVVNNTWVDHGPFNAGSQLVGLAFGPELGCNSADLAEPFGLLDLADVNAFVAAFTAGDPAADLDGNGLYDLTDVSMFVAAFTGDCP